MPVDIPANTPALKSIVAIDVLLLTQEPPPALLNADVVPIHTTGVPEIADGNGFTRNVVVLANGVTLQPDALTIELIVNVVLPVVLNPAIVKFPDAPVIVIVAEPVPVFAPLRV